MKAKPRGLDRHYGEQFDDPSIVDAYGARPPYPDALIPLVLEQATAPSPHILDLGCGTGELARRLAPHAHHVTAIDQSTRMIAAAKALPGGAAPNITWVVGRVEDASLSGPFSCAVAGQSFHWFDWSAAIGRLAAWLPSRRLILVDRSERPSPWTEHVSELVAAFSTNREFEDYDLVAELASRGLIDVEGEAVLGPTMFQQSVTDCVTAWHSRNGFSRDRMTPEAAKQFDAAVCEAIMPYAADGVVTLGIETAVAWVRVLDPG